MRYRTWIEPRAVTCTLAVLLTLLLAGAPAAAQFASMVPADAETTAEDAMLLERALAELEAQHKVLFLYKSDLVDAKTVRLPETASLDAALQQMLTPHALKYARVGERSYVIVHRDDPVPGAVSTTAGRLQTGAITGTVYDNMDTPLPGAQVALEGTMLGDVTGTDGTYSITGVPAGDYTVRASFVGFTTQQVEVTIPDGETVTQDFTLSPDVMQMEGVVTTATRSERTQKEATVSLSVLSAEDIQEVTPNSQADILRSVPGVHTEGGGGEAASNVFVRGLPAPGQYKYNPIEENGMPVQAEGRMTTSARDIYYRYDLNVERLEFVRGGSSALFGVGSPAGIINYIDKTGSAVQETILQTQVGQNNLYRFDFHTSGPLSENYRYSLGGFYRYDEGPVVTGLPTEGLQLKGNITRLLDDGYLRLHAKYLDDEAQFFLPFPHETESQEAADGIDGDEITTINAEEAADFSFRTPDGVFESDMANGIVARGAQVMFEAFRDLGDGFTVESKTKWTDMHHEFNIFIPFPAFIPTDDYGSQFVDDPETQRARFTYANSPTNAAYTGQYVIDQGAWDWERPYTDIATDLQVSKDFVAGTATHNVTVGAFLSRTQVNQRDIHNSVLVEFADQPQLLDLTIQNAGEDGQFGTEDDTFTPVTHEGLTNAVGTLGSVYVNNYITSNKIAGYVGDEISFGEALRVDVGVRYEIRRAEWTVESSEPTGEDGEFGEALALQGFQWGNGDFTRRDVYSDDLAASVGVNYGLTDVLNLYAVGSRGYFFPELVSLTSGAEIGDLENEKFLQVEGGVKAGSPTISGTLALYYTELNDRFAADPRVDPETGVVTTVPAQIGGSQTFGVEATAAYLVPAIDGLRLDAMVTFQDHQYTDYTSGDNDFTGNWIRRQPKVMLRGAAQYEQEGFDLRVNAKYTGKRFADEANFQELDPYTVVNAGAGYTASFAEGQSLRFGVHVFNALDSRGLTEGDPRLPPGTSIEDQPFFNARPILPRRVVAKLTYNL